MSRYLALAIFCALALLLGAGLRLDPRALPSPLIDHAAPAFALPDLRSPQKQWSAEQLRGRVWLLNVWASWCVSCREEHALLVELARSGVVPIYGLNYKDASASATNWLDEFGDPYAASLSDVQGRVGIDYGVVGVPETFVIDRHGVIRDKHVGPLTAEVLRTKILPKVKALQG
jgi:cytochrome c biogenesis protein CcmG/thiol:disulfide interchange protein DsbE